MKAAVRLIFTVALIFSFAEAAFAQLGMFSKDQLVALTREWHGDRFPDGRRGAGFRARGIGDVNAEQAWNVLIPHGYKYQFEGGWREINPGLKMIGRVFTAVFMPQRPDVNDIINERGKAAGYVGSQNSWPIDMLSPGDVLVVDLFGKIKDGTYAGDNLSTAIFAKSARLWVLAVLLRDESGISDKGDVARWRGFDPLA